MPDMPSRRTMATAAGVAAAAGAAAAGFLVAARNRKEPIYHVRPDGEGWVVAREGKDDPRSVHRAKKGAVQAGRREAREHAPSHLVIHGADGGVQRSHKY